MEYKDKEYLQPRFEDAEYDDAMRRDPLTGMDEIKKELSQIDSNAKAREEARIESERASNETAKEAESKNETETEKAKQGEAVEE